MASILKSKSFFGSKPTQVLGEVANTSALASERGSLDSVMAQARAILEQCQKDCEQLRDTARKEAVEEGLHSSVPILSSESKWPTWSPEWMRSA
jgi:hypothetical protein